MEHLQSLRGKLNECLSILDIMEQAEKRDQDFKIKLPFEGEYRITQLFGENPKTYEQFGYKGHFGIDFATPYGTKITACDEGTVTRNAFSAGNGHYIEIEHKWGKSLYMHFQSPALHKVGAKVRKAELIGYSGNSGYVIPKPTPQNPKAGSHLHFSMKINGVSNPDFGGFIDPYPFFENIEKLAK